VVENGLRVRRADGTEVDFIPASAAASFDVGEARELKVAAGDWLLLQANQGRDFINGERVQVREIQKGRIALTDGRTLPAAYNTFTHGYAVTSHSSQSKTVDDVLLVASSKSFAAVNREQFYVSISRGRERVHVFTDDTELLARRVTDSRERKAAVELQALRDDLAKLGYVRRESIEEKSTLPALAWRGEFRSLRPMRGSNRVMRPTRLAPVQRIAQVIEAVHRWLGEVLSPGQQTDAVAQIEPADSSKQAEIVKPTQAVKPTETVKESPKQRQFIRRKIGRGIAPPGDTGHSRGMGV
jgi:hypothetical protein